MVEIPTGHVNPKCIAIDPEFSAGKEQCQILSFTRCRPAGPETSYIKFQALLERFRLTELFIKIAVAYIFEFAHLDNEDNLEMAQSSESGNRLHLCIFNNIVFTIFCLCM